jgi:molybdate transport system substrate-binding protein
VFAAASLTEAFTEMGKRLEVFHPGLRLRFNFAGSQALRTQLEQGASADVFAAANMAQMSLAKQSGVVQGETPIFIKNRLVAIVPRSNPGQVSAFSDLAKPGLRLILAGPHVPVGHYSRQAIQRAAADYGADFDERVLKNLVSEEHNVKQVVTKVQLGEADVGLSYISDITPSTQQEVQIIPIPDAYNQIATYPIARLKGAQNPVAAAGFMQFVLSPQGQRIMKSYNFTPIKEP